MKQNKIFGEGAVKQAGPGESGEFRCLRELRFCSSLFKRGIYLVILHPGSAIRENLKRVKTVESGEKQ